MCRTVGAGDSFSVMKFADLFADLLVVILAGTLSGIACKRWGVSLLVGYLIVGAVIGRGGLGLVDGSSHELEVLAEAGALLLLFAVGIEFSFSELAKLGRFFAIGGAVQMLLVAAPLGLAAKLAGLSTSGAVLAGAAGGLSSTILVFRALAEQGRTESPAGRSAIAILLFQDVALVPLLLLVPLLTGRGEPPTLGGYLALGGKSVAFLAGVLALHLALDRFILATVARLRSVELLVLLTVTLLGLLGWTAYRLDLPPAIGAFAAGIALSGNRLTKQIDTVILPFRETFAAIFFVTLGMLLRPGAFLSEPLLLSAGLVGVLALKSLAAAVAMRACGLTWRAALGMGLGLSQLGEFSFLLVSRGVQAGLIDAENYNRMLFIALASLVLTPWLLRRGLVWAGEPSVTLTERSAPRPGEPAEVRVVVIGIGPIGGQIAATFETSGIDVAMIDLSPINLHPYAQQGFATYAGDATDLDVLERAEIHDRRLAVVCVPKDDAALEIVRALRAANPRLAIIVRCRYQLSAVKLRQAGALQVVSEEQEAAGPLLRRCKEWLDGAVL